MQLTEKQAVIPRIAQNEYCVFEYLYRDASNYKAWGALLLSGIPSQSDMAALRACLESDVYFVAEQVGIPAVYKELWDLSGGRSSDDHALHEFIALRVATVSERKTFPLFGDLSSLLKAFQSVSKWDYSLSPNFDSYWNWIITSGGADIVSSVVRGFPDLDATFLSASQHRKSRAGRSFEQHIARLLRDGRIALEEQAVTGGRRPDFVLPSLVVLKAKKRTFEEAMVLSAKTTLRERWKQVAMEKFNCALFLATVDDRVSSAAIDDMSNQGIHLVVPESLKKSKETCYNGKTNVITFREFFDEEISLKRPRFRRI